MYQYLRTHAQVYLSTPKEPHYFADDFGDRLRRYTDEKTYLEKLFGDAKHSHLVVGEASPSYLYSQNAIANIRRFNPEAKLLVMLRNPADMAYSLHSQHVYGFCEEEKDFAKAWRLQAERKAGRRIPSMCPAPAFLLYKEYISFGKQMQRTYTHFPREQVKVIFFEDLSRDAQAVYYEILRFLDLAPDGRLDFPVVNPNKTHRIQWLSKAARSVPPPIMNPLRKFKSYLGLENVSLVGLVNKINRVKVSRTPMPEDLRQEILAAVQPDIELLESLTGRDLSCWKRK